ncbi:class I adenylate-forming enzyme family protein [Sneathiella sp.]|uniref:class I adenylate-forming enzyme family protein n=1 Tax=Sneathiella sp. TaxID=1964365 RepID=UPI002615FBF0|nr:class I adenylate-forming enzyme family protein [Sneathiella sp.]MDF2368145.1 class I adenylate-forming enzyme family protein [Sneathiella sp.]
MTDATDTLHQPADLANILSIGLQKRPDDIALISRRAKWTWRELEDMSSRLAKSYLAFGLKPGDRVASLMPNRWELVVNYLACIKAGLVATPLNYRYMAPEIDHALGLSGAVVLLAHAERASDLAETELVRDLPLGVITFGGASGDGPHVEDMINNEPPGIDLPVPDLDAPFVIFFTSGSTGKPKGVTHSLRTMGWMCGYALVAMDINEDDVMLPGSSLSHMGGFLWGLSILALGARLIVARSFDGNEMLPILREFKPTVLSMIPAALFELVRDRHGVHDDFASLRLCVSGGDKISSVLEHEFMRKAGIIISEVYGMTEIGFSHFNADKSVDHLGSVGTVAPAFEAVLLDDDHNEVPLNTAGRLWVRAKCTTSGYWGNQSATDESYDADGWFDTGDIMQIDEQGFYWFCGRKKQIIVHDGSNICPQEVEEALQGHTSIEHAGVVGVHDLVHGENVVAYVTVQAGEAVPAASEVIAFAKTKIGYKTPEEIVFLDEMPFNATGKVDRVTLKRLAEEAHGIDA